MHAVRASHRQTPHRCSVGHGNVVPLSTRALRAVPRSILVPGVIVCWPGRGSVHLGASGPGLLASSAVSSCRLVATGTGADRRLARRCLPVRVTGLGPVAGPLGCRGKLILAAALIGATRHRLAPSGMLAAAEALCLGKGTAEEVEEEVAAKGKEGVTRKTRTRPRRRRTDRLECLRRSFLPSGPVWPSGEECPNAALRSCARRHLRRCRAFARRPQQPAARSGNFSLFPG